MSEFSIGTAWYASGMGLSYIWQRQLLSGYRMQPLEQSAVGQQIEGMREAHHARVAKLREKGITISLVRWGKEDIAGFAKAYRPA
ncbi:hypothetical protein Hypma_003913 [Hypsizygus marmoreus]|uniref:Uncharacterized protein n=1 Tax=Hypsizygus marmoreus TaxID=39966 RepID=A0A369K1W3_HYPMA|nr:hypothetical protein Hypma_003913 [Hypsizygus marmoreus]